LLNELAELFAKRGNLVMNSPPPTTRPWHAETTESVLKVLESSDSGLSKAEAARRRRLNGPNSLPEKGPATIWTIVLRQFISPLIYILVAAAVVSAMIGDLKDASFIGVVLLLNTMIGAYQEWHAEQSSHALKKLLCMHAHVKRDGDVLEVNAEEVVPGDVIWLESGNRVPADIRLLLSQGLEVDESLLTGESLAVRKDSSWVGEEDATLADQQNMTFAGSLVARGRAKGIVVAIGTATQVGQLALDVMGSGAGKPPLLERMERFTNFIAIGTVIAALGIGLLGSFIWGHTIVEAFFFAVALAVAAIPEGLPVAITVALAVATTRMAKRNVIVRNLTAVEGLGSCTMIATDKTGTLTCNELTVREILLADGTLFTVTGEGFAPKGEIYLGTRSVRQSSHVGLDALVQAVVLCNEAELHHRDDQWVWQGDAVDIAALNVGVKLGTRREQALESYPQVSSIPFESEHQFAASFHQIADRIEVYVKGAPERIFDMCSADALSANPQAKLEELSIVMATRGFRVLAVAKGHVTGGLPIDEPPPKPKDLEVLGFLGMIDPLRAGARESVAECQRAGVLVSMVTGDHQVTALAIARDLGLAQREDQVVTAADLEGKSIEQLGEMIQDVRVFARVTPKQKLQIVEAARKAGHYVAVTGDGVNDAPALRAANIGVAMGKAGTDVAREAADLVISDDNFNSIVGGIEEGRIAYDNIRKVIYQLLSLGAAELVLVLLAVITGLPLPLLPIQLLWLNLVTDGIQGVAIVFEPGEGDTLRRKPRPPSESIFNRLMVERLLVAVLVVGCGGFLVYAIAIRSGYAVNEARNLLLLTMVLFENFHVGNCRSETRSAFSLSPLRSPVLFFGTLTAFLIHVVAMHVPLLQDLLSTGPVDLWHWGIAIAVSITIVPAIDFHKWWWKRRTIE
jgi:P-type Ca2+ transporter type 2C